MYCNLTMLYFIFFFLILLLISQALKISEHYQLILDIILKNILRIENKVILITQIFINVNFITFFILTHISENIHLQFILFIYRAPDILEFQHVYHHILDQ